MLKDYLKNIHEIADRGDATEQSYYSLLESLMLEFAEFMGNKKVKVTTIPKKTDAGKPDTVIRSRADSEADLYYR